LLGEDKVYLRLSGIMKFSESVCQKIISFAKEII
jgi:hypothetical protein